MPLPPETYDALREEAEARGIPATTLVGEAVEGWLDDQKSNRLRDEIAGYALEMGGTGADLDSELEAAAEAEMKAVTGRR
ncbi:MAG: hypothetical protein IPP07_23930 [Holophagales bacterium]|nr:hypothetical protein [Holophagales bacterium]MBK9967757.1 hypothetical protein [Holophagales bacterium]